MKRVSFSLLFSTLSLLSQALFASGAVKENPAFIQFNNPFYIAAGAGIMSANFNLKYNDLLDVIPQNFANSVSQNGYTGGLAVGYSHLVFERYLIGLELSGNALTNNYAKLYQGSSSAAFNDTLQLKYFVDLDIVPGILLTDSVAAHLKLGLSNASVYDSLTSPTGLIPGITNYHYTKTQVGFAAGLGVKKYLSSHWSVFSEFV